MTEITMPKLSDTMTEGRLGVWKKSLGDNIERGEIIAEVETDKAVMELEAFTSGILLETRIKAGELVAVGTVIGVIGNAGEVAEALPAIPLVEIQPSPIPVTDSFSEKFILSSAKPESPLMPHGEEHHDGRASPAIRRHARELGVDLTLISGSGPNGRVLLEDLERYIKGTSPAGPESVSQGGLVVRSMDTDLPSSPASVSDESQSLSPMRAALARTFTASWQSIPHFSLTVEVNMDAAEEIRRELRSSGTGTALSVNDFILKAAALALRKYPRVNSSLNNDRIITHDAVNIGIAVSLPDGLLVPVIRDCDTLKLQEIATESRRLVAAARKSRLNEKEITGGSFTVSNLGMYGITSFTAIILPTQAALLAVGMIREAVVPRNNMPYIAKIMSLTLSADHRLLDGASAADFLNQIRSLLETPVLLLA